MKHTEIFKSPEDMAHAIEFFEATLFAHLHNLGHSDDDILAMLTKAIKDVDLNDIKEPVHKSTPEGMVTSNMHLLANDLLVTEEQLVAMHHIKHFEAKMKSQSSTIH